MKATMTDKPDFPGHPVSDLPGAHLVCHVDDLLAAKAAELAAENAELQNRLGVSAMLSEAAIETFKALESFLREANDLLADVTPATADDLASRVTAAINEMPHDVCGPDRKH